MERQLDQLIEILEETRTLYENLLTLIGEEKAAATASDFDRFSRVSAEKEGLVVQLRTAESHRNEIMRQVADTMGLPADQLSLSELAGRVDAARAHHLSDLGSALKHLVARVREANRECCMIIEHCLVLVKKSLGFFQHWMQFSTVYGQTGNICSDRGTGGRLVSDSV